MNIFQQYKQLTEKVSSLQDLANKYKSEARKHKGTNELGYHQAMADYHNALMSHHEKVGEHASAQKHEDAFDTHMEAIKKLSTHVKESEVVTERIDMPQGHEHIGDPISKDSKEGTGRKKSMMGQTSSLIQTIARILSKG